MRALVNRLGIVAVVLVALLGATQVAATGPVAASEPPACEYPDPCDDGGGGGGGGPVIPPFNPPPGPGGVEVPLSYDGVELGQQSTCNQKPHPILGFSTDVPRGTTLYASGVVARYSRANFAFYNEAGQVAKTHLTNRAGGNCVIAHEAEAISTWDLAPGYYYVYTSIWTLPYYNSGVWVGYPLGLTYALAGVIRIR